MSAYGRALADAVKYGLGVTTFGVRKWYNPMRWIKGKIYVKYVLLHNLYK